MTDSNTPPHEILGVDPDATEEEIKHAFREGSKRHHPDHSEDPNAQQIFIELKNARDELLEGNRSERESSPDSTSQSAETEPSPREQSTNQQRRRERTRDRHRNRKQRRKNRRQRQRDRTRQWDRDRRHTEAYGETVRSLKQRILTSPTLIRLGLTVVLSLVILYTVGGYVVGLSGVLLVSLIVSYVGFGIVATRNRTRRRFKPAGRQPLWPIIPAHLLGVGLFVLGLQNDAFAAGFGYAITSVVYAITVWVGVLAVGTVSIEFVRWLASLPLYSLISIPLRGLWYAAHWLNAKLLRYPLWSRLHGRWDLPPFGFVLSGVLASTILFTPVGSGLTIKAMVESAFPQYPWVPAFTVGPIYLDSLLNWSFGVVLLVCGVGSYIAAGWALTSVPWTDRYEYGFRIRPTPWNLLFIAPWILFVMIPFITIVGSASWTTVWFYAHPSLFVGAYILRRYAEEQVRYGSWL